MATDTQLEAQKLVSISLSKMAQSRTLRTGISLHKSLLVATVLQKARFLCMEEVFRMVHSTAPYQNNNNNNHDVNDDPYYDFEDDDNLIGLTAGEAAISNQNSNLVNYSDINSDDNPFSQNYTKYEISSECDKENMSPETPTYFDLDKTPKDQIFKDKSSSITSCLSSSYCKNLKRRRAVCDSETEEAVQSILPKKNRLLSFDSDCEDSVFGDDDTFFTDNISVDETDYSNPKSMDIDRITSLVSIFSFSGIAPSSSTTNLSETSSCTINNSYGNLNRSSSAPDLCSAQAKEASTLQQRSFIAMTVN